ncbi:MAG: hypothetical protein NT013_23350 [Planctomycetia bacterium]|nr:hypothetical protein [Planctomycetia bacterium]
MTQIVIDPEMREKLLQSNLVEFVDESGAVLGSFISYGQGPSAPSLIPAISDEERKRLYSETGMFTTEQVLERLRSL